MHIVGVGGFVEQRRPAGVVAGKLLELRGDGDRLVGESVERSVGPGAEREAFDGGRPVAEPVHLLARQHQPYRALQRQRAQRGQHDLILRTEPCAERAADVRRYHAQLVRLLVEHAAQIALHVLHALGLVIDRQLAAAVPHHGGGKQLHRVVMLGRDEILGLVADIGRGIGLGGIAMRLFGLLDHKGLIALLVEVGDEGLLLILDVNERGRVAGGFPFLRQHQRDRLAAEHDPVVVQRPERRAFLRRDIVLPGLVGVGHAGAGSRG